MLFQRENSTPEGTGNYHFSMSFWPAKVIRMPDPNPRLMVASSEDEAKVRPTTGTDWGCQALANHSRAIFGTWLPHHRQPMPLRKSACCAWGHNLRKSFKQGIDWGWPKVPQPIFFMSLTLRIRICQRSRFQLRSSAYIHPQYLPNVQMKISRCQSYVPKT